MPTAVIDRIFRRREARVGKSANRNRDAGVLATFFGVKHRRAAHRTETESESGSVIADANVFCRDAGNFIGRRECGKGSKHAAGTLLARKAMANARSEQFAMYFDA